MKRFEYRNKSITVEINLDTAEEVPHHAKTGEDLFFDVFKRKPFTAEQSRKMRILLYVREDTHF